MKTLSNILWMLSTLAMLGVAWLDYITGRDVALWALYLLPIALSSSFISLRAGIFFSLLAGVFMLINGIFDGSMDAMQGIFLLILANRTAALLLVAWLASRLHRQRTLEHELQFYEQTLDYYHVSPKTNGVDGVADASASPIHAVEPDGERKLHARARST